LTVDETAPTATLVFRSRAFLDRRRVPSGTKTRRSDGITLACGCGMAKTPTQTGSEEPTVVWRMQRPDGQSSHAIIGPRLHGVAVIWFVNGQPLGLRDFDDWSDALRWSEQMQAQNCAAGWRLAPEMTVPPRGGLRRREPGR
jgi:hypothetical protein